MEEIEYKILQKVVEIYEGTRRYANAEEIATFLDIDYQSVVDFLDILDDEGYIKTIHASGGYCSAMPTHRGRLMITHPDYMQKKGYAVACLKVLEEAIAKDDNIPDKEKQSFIQTLRGLYEDPYLVSIGSGLIVEGIKKVFGM